MQFAGVYDPRVHGKTYVAAKTAVGPLLGIALLNVEIGGQALPTLSR
jgi:hypothetical protein